MPSFVSGSIRQRSPTFQPFTSAPTCAISPAASAPEIHGIGTGKPGMPRRTKMSK